MVFLKILIYLFAVVPDPVVMLLARFANLFFYPGVRKNKWKFIKIAEVIPKLFPDRDEEWRRRVIRANALHVLKIAGESLKSRFVKRRRGNRKCYIGEGREHLESLLASRAGFVIITGHLGNFEYGAAYIAMNFRRVHALVAMSDTPGSRMMNWGREGHNVVLLESSRDPRVSARTLVQMIRLLNQGEIIFLVADQGGRGGEVEGTLFGKRLRFFGGPFVIGKRTRKPFLPLYCLRDEGNRIALNFDPPFFLDGEDPVADVEKVTAFFEKIMREHPEQYLWSKDRWK